MKQRSLKKLAVGAIAAAAMLGVKQSVQAQSLWNVANGNYSVAGNWSPAGMPGGGDEVLINNGGTATINAVQEAATIGIGSQNGTSGSLSLTSGGQLFVYDVIRVGERGTGTMSVNNAAIDVTVAEADIFVGGQDNGGTGTFTLSGNASSINIGDDFVMGRVGTGTLNYQGGLVKSGYAVVAKYGTGVWNQSGGVFDQSFGDFEIGDGGNLDFGPGARNGTVNLTGGVMQVAGYFSIGNRIGTGTVNISGGVLAVDNAADGAIVVGRGYESGALVGQGGPASLRVTGDDAIIIANGNFDMNSSGVASSSTLIAEITGATHTTIKVGGNALLANGKLAVDLTGYVPNVGDSWTILQAGVDVFNAPEIAQIDSLVAASLDPSLGHVMVHNPQALQGTLQGTFQSIDYSQAVLPAGRGWNISYANNSVVLSVVSTGPAFSADFNNDGKVDGTDLTKWKQSFGGVGADANNDGTSNGADFLMWQQQFGSGVSAAPAVGAVPEPASVALAGLAAAVVAVGLRRSR
jgi:T5SS/PEP-CTERM-associated repeat protein